MLLHTVPLPNRWDAFCPFLVLFSRDRRFCLRGGVDDRFDQADKLFPASDSQNFEDTACEVFSFSASPSVPSSFFFFARSATSPPPPTTRPLPRKGVPQMYFRWKGSTMKLQDREVTIGRDEKSAVVLADMRVSRRHAIISNGVLISTGRCGTRVNNRLVRAPLSLKRGDVIRIGTESLCVRSNKAFQRVADLLDSYGYGHNETFFSNFFSGDGYGTSCSHFTPGTRRTKDTRVSSGGLAERLKRSSGSGKHYGSPFRRPWPAWTALVGLSPGTWAHPRASKAFRGSAGKTSVIYAFVINIRNPKFEICTPRAPFSRVDFGVWV